MEVELVEEVKRDMSVYGISCLCADNVPKTLDDCRYLLKLSDFVRGYSIFIAKEVICKGDDERYKGFLQSIELGYSGAEKLLRFYKNKNANDEEGLLPDTATSYEAITFGKGTGGIQKIEDKIERYSEIKDILGEKAPTSVMISVVSKVLNRGIRDKELIHDFCNTISNYSMAVKRSFISNSKTAGLKKVLKVMKEHKSDGEVINLISGQYSSGLRASLNKVKLNIRHISMDDWANLTSKQQFEKYNSLVTQLHSV